VHVAHIGDARVIVGIWSKTEPRLLFESEDHKPGLPSEKARLVAAGMEVREDQDGDARIFLPGERFPGLTMSRAFGDTASKGVVQDPDYKLLEVGEEAEIFAILASDGIWEFMEPKDILEFTTKKLRLRGPGGTAAYLVDLARKLWAKYQGDYCDDITALVAMRNIPRKNVTGDHKLTLRPHPKTDHGA
jgi:serine/threonine protein phosphatase PrpC